MVHPKSKIEHLHYFNSACTAPPAGRRSNKAELGSRSRAHGGASWPIPSLHHDKPTVSSRACAAPPQDRRSNKLGFGILHARREACRVGSRRITTVQACARSAASPTGPRSRPPPTASSAVSRALPPPRGIIGCRVPTINSQTTIFNLMCEGEACGWPW